MSEYIHNLKIDFDICTNITIQLKWFLSNSSEKKGRNETERQSMKIAEQYLNIFLLLPLVNTTKYQKNS